MPLKNIPEELRPQYESCVEKVRAKGNGNEYAICYASVVEGASTDVVAELFNLDAVTKGIIAEFSNSPQQNSECFAVEPFKAIDPAKPLKIIPFGKFYRDNRVLDITDERLAEAAKNFNAGLPRYGVVVNVEHNGDSNQPGKVGRVKSVKHVPGDGLYADQIEYTEVGKKLIGEERYDAPSAEMVWSLNNGAKYQDPETGKTYDNVLAGLALTNSPFFGSRVAVFSAKQDKEKFMDPTMIAQMKDMLKKMFGMLGAEAQPQPTPNPQPPANPGGNMTDQITAEQFNGLKTQLEQVNKLVEEFKVKAAEADTLKTKLEAAEAEGKKLAEQFTAEQMIRRTNEFIEDAEEFSAIPTASGDLGKQLLWMHDSDGTEKKDHYVYFKTLLETLNAAMGQSALFEQFGTARPGNQADAHPFLAAVEKIIVERYKDKPRAEAFRQAFTAAASEHKDLAAQYLIDKRAHRI